MFAEIFSIHMMATALITILQHSAKHTHTLTNLILQRHMFQQSKSYITDGGGRRHTTSGFQWKPRWSSYVKLIHIVSPWLLVYLCDRSPIPDYKGRGNNTILRRLVLSGDSILHKVSCGKCLSCLHKPEAKQKDLALQQNRQLWSTHLLTTVTARRSNSIHIPTPHFVTAITNSPEHTIII